MKCFCWAARGIERERGLVFWCVALACGERGQKTERQRRKKLKNKMCAKFKINNQMLLLITPHSPPPHHHRGEMSSSLKPYKTLGN
jgi:hypothetical protein